MGDLALAMEEQARWCLRLGSPLYHGLLLRIAENVRGSGICGRVLEPFGDDPPRALLPLRFLATLHRMALEGSAPDLARRYPSCGGIADSDAAWKAMVPALERDVEGVRARLPRTVQTNEVSRSCGLLPGFGEITQRTALPLRLLEIGCSAGLNLRWDCYRYESSGGAWGPVESQVVFRDAFAGKRFPRMGRVRVAERRGCDLNPLEPTDDGRLTLLSFVWPDQMERFEQVSRAFEIAQRVPVELERSDAVEWLERQLSRRTPGVATVVFHSIVWMYLPGEARRRLELMFAEAGSRATAEAPLAWLSMERGEVETDVNLTWWPGRERRCVARAGFHRRRVEIICP
jgi:hypothetical protein